VDRAGAHTVFFSVLPIEHYPANLPSGMTLSPVDDQFQPSPWKTMLG